MNKGFEGRLGRGQIGDDTCVSCAELRDYHERTIVRNAQHTAMRNQQLMQARAAVNGQRMDSRGTRNSSNWWPSTTSRCVNAHDGPASSVTRREYSLDWTMEQFLCRN
jgi:hypothetical protein